ncbi:MAG TPA: diaminopimelate decarboxylase [Vicinamibacterales bacterium]|nr:diaminopimelate decarboxylase [Vicinamibacterales bacterium]
MASTTPSTSADAAAGIAEAQRRQTILSDIAAALGTPCYVYDAGAIRKAYARLDEAFDGYPHAIHYALKANSTLAVVRLLQALGSHADANSPGEVDVAFRCGFRPDQIVFTGVGKSAAEIDRAVALGLLAINVESPGELDRIDQRAIAQGVQARVALRVNPDIDAKSHPHISTGLKSNKFGVPIDAAPALFREMASRRGLHPVGAHVHIGSQITTLDPLTKAADAVVALARNLRSEGVELQHLDMGGGLGISYDGTPVVDPAEYVRALVAATRGSGLKVAIEPGRVLVGPAGALLSKVVDVKQFPGAKRFIVLDAGMTELMRPALYNAYHRIEPLIRRDGDHVAVDIVGPICESTDAYARDRTFPPVEVGDVVSVCDVGAYGAVMGHTYLRRPLSPEVLIDGDEWRVIRRRQTLDELLALESE